MKILLNENGDILSVFEGVYDSELAIEVEDVPENVLADLSNYRYVDGEFQKKPPAPPIVYDVEPIKSAKITQIKAMCAEKITAGFTADVLGRGQLHYSLTQTQQDDLKVLVASIQASAPAVLWHDSSRVMHEQYTAQQFLQLYQLAMAHVITCKLHSDGLEQLAVNLASEDNPDVQALEAIQWETILPPEIQAVVEAQIQMMLGGGGDG